MANEVLVVSRRTQRLLCDINGILCDKRNSGSEPPPTMGMSHVEAAGIRAAMEDGIIPPDLLIKASPMSLLRRGQWTEEEEAYSNRLITEFRVGTLPLMDGTTLRTFLSKVLNCDPMRISKKFVGDNCIGKQSFRRHDVDPRVLSQTFIEIMELERMYFEKVAEKKSRLSLKDDISSKEKSYLFEGYRDPVGMMIRQQTQQQIRGPVPNGNAGPVSDRILSSPSSSASTSWSGGFAQKVASISAPPMSTLEQQQQLAQMVAGRRAMVGSPSASGTQTAELQQHPMMSSAGGPASFPHQQMPGYNSNTSAAAASMKAFYASTAAHYEASGAGIYGSQRMQPMDPNKPAMGSPDMYRSQFDGYQNQALDYTAMMRQRYEMAQYPQSPYYSNSMYPAAAAVSQQQQQQHLPQQPQQQQSMYANNGPISMPPPSSNASSAQSAAANFGSYGASSSGVLSAAASLAALSSASDESATSEHANTMTTEQATTSQLHHHQLHQQQQQISPHAQEQSHTDSPPPMQMPSYAPHMHQQQQQTQHQHHHQQQQQQQWRNMSHALPAGPPGYYGMVGGNMAAASSVYHPQMSMPYAVPAAPMNANYYMGGMPYGQMKGYYPMGSHSGMTNPMYDMQQQQQQQHMRGLGGNLDALSALGVADRGIKRPRHIADINAIIEGKRKVASAAGSVGAVAVSGTAAVTSSLSAPPPPRAQGGAVATRSGPLSTIEAAGREAAIEDGVIAPPGASLEGLHVSAQDSRGSYGGDASASNLRRGKWTIEEEAYAMRLIAEFREGMLPLTDGTTLRTFLAKILNCDPMRISKKFVGKKCIGKQIFRRNQFNLTSRNKDDEARTNSELLELERRFLEKVAEMNRKLTSKFSEAFLEGGISMSGVRGFDMPVDLQMQLSATAPHSVASGSSLRSLTEGGGGGGMGAATPAWLRRPMLPPSASTELLSALSDAHSSSTNRHISEGGQQEHSHDASGDGAGSDGRPPWASASSSSSKSRSVAPAVSVPFTLYQMQVAQAGGSTENPWGKDIKKTPRSKGGSKTPKGTNSSNAFTSAVAAKDSSSKADGSDSGMKRSTSLDFMAHFLGVDVRLPSNTWLENFSGMQHENSTDFAWPQTSSADFLSVPPSLKLSRMSSSNRVGLGEHSDSTADLMALLGSGAGARQSNATAADMYRGLHEDDSYSNTAGGGKLLSPNKHRNLSSQALASSDVESTEMDSRPDASPVSASIPRLAVTKNVRAKSTGDEPGKAPSHRLVPTHEHRGGGNSNQGDFWEFVDINDESPSAQSFPTVTPGDSDSSAVLVRQSSEDKEKRNGLVPSARPKSELSSPHTESAVDASVKRKFHVLESSS